MKRKTIRALKKDYKEIILRTIAVAGILSVGLVAPNALQIIPYLQKHAYAPHKYQTTRSLRNLARKGFVRLETKGTETRVTLTRKGRQELIRYTMRDFLEPDHWDGKWRMVIFDITDKMRKQRDMLRFHLKNIGFYQLQKSVWIFPYECIEMISLIRENFKVGHGVVYLVVEKMEGDKKLRQYFDLPK